jgi:hypothetical protein
MKSCAALIARAIQDSVGAGLDEASFTLDESADVDGPKDIETCVRTNHTNPTAKDTINNDRTLRMTLSSRSIRDPI